MSAYSLINASVGSKLFMAANACLSLFVPIRSLAAMLLLFVAVDFIVGLIVSVRVKKQGFITKRFWDTVYKLVGVEVVLALTWLLDERIIQTDALSVHKIIAGIICGAELWSILTNFSILSNHPVFRLIQRWGKSEIENKMGSLKDFDKELENKNMP